MNNTKKINIRKINNDSWEEVSDTIIVEKPLKIYINEQFYTVMMCTPSEAIELTIGFLFSEGIISSMKSIESIEEKFDDRVCVILREDIKIDFDAIQATTSGCGKGSIQLRFIEGWGIETIQSNHEFSFKTISRLMKEFNCKSELFIETGGVHSCSICDNEGIVLFSEDIGRHNALDKAIGKAIINNINLQDKLIMTTGRISSDIIIKAVKAGIPVIISHSAPTNLALEIAESANLTVIGFARGFRMNVYCGAYRVNK
jgi:FdhD protein